MRYFAEVENGIVQMYQSVRSSDTLSASFTWVETFLDGGSRRNTLLVETTIQKMMFSMKNNLILGH